MLGLGGDEPHPHLIAGIDVMGVDPSDDRRIGDLDPRTTVVVVGDDRVEQLTLASVEHDRFGEVERRPVGALARCSPAAIASGNRSNAASTSSGSASPLAMARTAPMT